MGINHIDKFYEKNIKFIKNVLKRILNTLIIFLITKKEFLKIEPLEILDKKLIG